jgi:CRISPR-associated protein (TIGR02710 family)
MSENKGLILTLGLSPEPLVYAINNYNATHIVFIGTPESIDKSLDKIIEETNLRPSKFRTHSIEDSPGNIGVLVSKFHEGYLWLKSCSILNESIIADPTGGRKWMSSGATIAASFLGLNMIYIDAKFDQGKPVLDSMNIVPLGNAYDQTGFIAAEQGRIAFNSSSFETATTYFSDIRPSSSHRSEFFKGIARISNTLAKWDRFEHYDNKISDELHESSKMLDRSLKSGNGTPELVIFLEGIEKLKEGISELEGQSQLIPGFIIDIFQNAKRRFILNRYDDCVGRLYRTLEAISQYFLLKEFDIQADNPDYSKMNPEALQLYKNDPNLGELPLKLDLKRSFILLFLHDHQLGKSLIRQSKKGFNFELEGLLNDRNSSILAHGFKPVGREKSEKFMIKIEAVLKTNFGNEFEEWNTILTVPKLPRLGI